MRLVIESPLRSRLKAAAFLLVIGFSSLLLAGESVRIALATRIGESKNVVQMRKAVSLDSANPDLHFRLGMAETFDLEGSDPAEGIQQLQRATELSPHRPRYWVALASACEFEGRKNCASHATARVLALSPMTPRVHWGAANYYLWAGDQATALSQFQRLLELDPGYAGATFRVCLGATGSPEIVARNVLPPAASPELKLDYVNFLATHGDEDFAYHVWKEIVESKSPLKFLLTDPYLEHLIASRRYQESTSVWRDLEHRGIVGGADDHDPGNLIFNGGFEQAPLNAGFDWRYQQDPYVAVDFNDRQAYKGRYCLRLDFTDVENHQDEPVYQLVPVAANQAYMLTAHVRSTNMTSDSCPRLRVIDPACPACLSASSSPVVGTTGWHKIILKFQTGPQTRLVRLSVWRPRSLNYPTEIIGTLWLDKVSLRSIAAPFADQGTRRRGA